MGASAFARHILHNIDIFVKYDQKNNKSDPIPTKAPHISFLGTLFDPVA
jgi:hypothetical protein